MPPFNPGTNLRSDPQALLDETLRLRDRGELSLEEQQKDGLLVQPEVEATLRLIDAALKQNPDLSREQLVGMVAKWIARHAVTANTEHKEKQEIYLFEYGLKNGDWIGSQGESIEVMLEESKKRNLPDTDVFTPIIEARDRLAADRSLHQALVASPSKEDKVQVAGCTNFLYLYEPDSATGRVRAYAIAYKGSPDGLLLAMEILAGRARETQLSDTPSFDKPLLFGERGRITLQDIFSAFQQSYNVYPPEDAAGSIERLGENIERSDELYRDQERAIECVAELFEKLLLRDGFSDRQKAVQDLCQIAVDLAAKIMSSNLQDGGPAAAELLHKLSVGFAGRSEETEDRSTPVIAAVGTATARHQRAALPILDPEPGSTPAPVAGAVFASPRLEVTVLGGGAAQASFVQAVLNAESEMASVRANDRDPSPHLPVVPQDDEFTLQRRNVRSQLKRQGRIQEQQIAASIPTGAGLSRKSSCAERHGEEKVAVNAEGHKNGHARVFGQTLAASSAANGASWRETDALSGLSAPVGHTDQAGHRSRQPQSGQRITPPRSHGVKTAPVGAAKWQGAQLLSNLTASQAERRSMQRLSAPQARRESNHSTTHRNKTRHSGSQPEHNGKIHPHRAALSRERPVEERLRQDSKKEVLQTSLAAIRADRPAQQMAGEKWRLTAPKERGVQGLAPLQSRQEKARLAAVSHQPPAAKADLHGPRQQGDTQQRSLQRNQTDKAAHRRTQPSAAEPNLHSRNDVDVTSTSTAGVLEEKLSAAATDLHDSRQQGDTRQRSLRRNQTDPDKAVYIGTQRSTAEPNLRSKKKEIFTETRAPVAAAKRSGEGRPVERSGETAPNFRYYKQGHDGLSAISHQPRREAAEPPGPRQQGDTHQRTLRRDQIGPTKAGHGRAQPRTVEPELQSTFSEIAPTAPPGSAGKKRLAGNGLKTDAGKARDDASANEGISPVNGRSSKRQERALSARKSSSVEVPPPLPPPGSVAKLNFEQTLFLAMHHLGISWLEKLDIARVIRVRCPVLPEHPRELEELILSVRTELGRSTCGVEP